MFLEYEDKIQKGSYIFIAKEAINDRDFKGTKSKKVVIFLLLKKL